MARSRSRDETEDDKIVREALKRFKRCETWEATARRRWVEDEKFAVGDSDNLYQWPQQVRTARGAGTEDERPCLTINKTRQHVLQIINDARQNRTHIKFRPTGGGATYESAQIFDGIARHIEYISNAQQAYATATRHQVQSGLGYIRVTTDYAGPDTFDQEIFIKRVKNPLSIYLDPDIQEADGSDARFGFVFEDEPKDEFEIKYPKHKDIGKAALDNEYNWVTKDHVRVAEYFRVKETKDTLIAFKDPRTGETVQMRRSEFPRSLKPALNDILADPETVTREVIDRKVEWFKIAGHTIIERRPWLGRYVPIARVPGEETVIDGELDRKGHVRALKDPQRMYNYNAPLALDTPLPTPTGWTTMEKVETGDWLLDEAGKPVQVAGTSPTFLMRDCYRVEFDDGSHIVADGEHQWTVEERGKRRARTWDWSTRTISTEELTPAKHFIYAAQALDLPDADLPIHPYVLGAWLGDGSSAKAVIHSGLADMDEMRANLAACGYGVGEPRIYGDKTAAELTVFGIRGKLSAMKLLGNKHIPAIYLRASRRQREQLLQGLMDTDGNVQNAQCSFTSTIPALADGFTELLSSLGVKPCSRAIAARRATFPNGSSYDCQESRRFHFTTPDLNVFGLRRKATAQQNGRSAHPRRTKRHSIVSVTRVPWVPTKCVGIQSESRLFLAGPGMIPTHNSAQVEFGALQNKIPYIGAAEAIEGYEKYWETANQANYSVLPYNAYTDDGQRQIPAPARQAPPQASQAYQLAMTNAANDMMLVSGQYQADFGAPSNERSGVAIDKRQRQGATATYHYIDHQAMAIRFVGNIIKDLIPKIIDTRRVIKIMAEDGSDSEVLLDPTAAQAYFEDQQKNADAAKQVIFNPNVGRYDVEADVGPDYATRRQEAFNALSQIAGSNQELMLIIGDLLFKSADFQYADEIAQRLERMVPPTAKGEGPPPEVVKLQQLLQSQGMLLEQLSVKVREKEQALKDKVGDLGIGVYDAETKRLAALKDYLAVDPDGLLGLIRQAVAEAMGGSLSPVPQLQGMVA